MAAASRSGVTTLARSAGQADRRGPRAGDLPAGQHHGEERRGHGVSDRLHPRLRLVRVSRPMPARNDDSKQLLRETAVNTHAVSRSLAVAAVLLAAPALAEQYGPLEIVGLRQERVLPLRQLLRRARQPVGLRSARRAVAAGADAEPGRRLGRHRPQPVPRAADARPVPRVRQRRKIEAKTSGAHAQHGRGHLRQLDDRPLRGRVAPDLRLAAGRQVLLALVDAHGLVRLSRSACRAPGRNRAPATASTRRPCATRPGSSRSRSARSASRAATRRPTRATRSTAPRSSRRRPTRGCTRSSSSTRTRRTWSS